jgi:hypothetical protein
MVAWILIDRSLVLAGSSATTGIISRHPVRPGAMKFTSEVTGGGVGHQGFGDGQTSQAPWSFQTKPHQVQNGGATPALR